MSRDAATEAEARWIEPRGFSILRPQPEPPSLPIPPPPPATVDDPHAVELLSWLPPLAARVRAREVAWLVARGIDPRDPMDARDKLLSAAEEVIGLRLRITDRAETLRATAAGASGAELQEVLARHLRATVRDPKALREDLRALDRDLDLATLLEREDGILETASVRLDVALLLLEGLVRVWPDHLERLVGDGRVEQLLVDRALNETWPPARRTAVSALASVVRAILDARFAHGPAGLRALGRLVRDPAENPWIRRRAVEVATALPDEIARPWAEAILRERDGNESFLVRAAVIRPLLERSATWATALLEACVEDPSSLVRLTLAEECARQWTEPEHRLSGVVRALAASQDPKVRAATLAYVPKLHEAAVPLIATALADVPQVARFAEDAIGRFLDAGERGGLPIVAALDAAAQRPEPEVARRAALLLERHAIAPAFAAIAQELATLCPGSSRVQAVPPEGTPTTLAQALLPYADEDHGFTIEITGPATVVVHRGDRSGFRLWRALFELRHPGPSKRQGYTHTGGRKNRGTVRVPPATMCEAASTGIPGERVQIGAIEGWGPALPTVDDYLDTLGQGAIVVVSAEGITAIDAPRGPWARLKARLLLTAAFERIDAARNAALAEQGERAHAYVRELERLGFRTSFEGRRTPGTVALPAVLDPLTYLVTLGANSLSHMAIVLAMLLCVLYGRVAYALRTARRNRASIPLVVGGWGTRGKSGTERIKAGLFQGLGVSLLSKTTGCEAMILHGPPLGRAIELFLFRPFDKATIWEQTDVIALAAGFESRVMLWECMGLNPKYVEILQSGWMRDDLSTLTNAYPDHEDVQGPTGLDVATIIGGFCAPGGKVMTTEDPNMLPVLREQARQRNATFFSIPVAERTLYADDLLARMPYAEHPSNVALAARVGTTLGVDRTEAIGLMAENVVPDLGALIIYPETKHLERKVTFINGMSANDFLSWRNNWKRVGFETHDHDANPGVFLMSVVNNRADRVPRSRVFARIVVMNANAHRHVLIGTNLSGFKNYVDEALDEKLRDVHLDGTVEVVDRLYAHLRIGDAGAIGAACARALGADETACRAWIAAVASAVVPSRPDLAEAERMAMALEPAMQALEAASPGSAGLSVGIAKNLRRETARWLALRAARQHPGDPAVMTLYRQLTHDGILFIMDSGTSGDRIIQQAMELVPPGSTVRLMGIQNIKGTGLDFAYQWVFWRELHRDIQGLADPKSRDRSLVAIEQNPFGSVFSCDEALKALAPWREDPALQARVQAIARRIEDKRAKLLHARVATVSKSGPWARLLWLVERLVDPFDAILRKRRARQVFADLIHQRIAHSTAQDELQRLTKRQKGGWLKP